MNRALIAIGIRNEDLEQAAIEIAREIEKYTLITGQRHAKYQTQSRI